MLPSMKKTAAIAAMIVALAAPVVSASSMAKAPPKFKTCKAMQAKSGYKNGVGLNKATDSTSGKTKPVTNFRRDYKAYLVNAARDGDKDGVACERKGATIKPPPKPPTRTPRPEPTPTPTPTATSVPE